MYMSGSSILFLEKGMVMRLVNNKKLTDAERLLECLNCEFFIECDSTVRHPVDNPDGSCKTKDLFLKRKGGGNENNG